MFTLSPVAVQLLLPSQQTIVHWVTFFNMDFEPLTLCFMLISAIITIYVNFVLSYWSRRGIPSVSSFSFRRFFLPLHLHDQLVYQTYGKIVGLYEGFRPTLMIGDPEIVKDILGKDFLNFPNRRTFNFGHLPNRVGLFFLKGSEEKWNRIRSLIHSHFSTSLNLRSITPKINECISLLLENLAQANLHQPVDMLEFYRAFSLDVVASTAFGIRIDSLRQPDHPIVSNARKFFGPRPISRILFEIYLTFSHMRRIRPSDFELRYFARLAERITREKRYMQKRKVSSGLLNGKNKDFIQMFLDIIDQGDERLHDSIEEENEDFEEETDQVLKDLSDPITVYGHEHIEQDVGKNYRRKRSISIDEVKAQGILFFMAGYSGNASLLSNISYLLSTNPKQQEKLIQELDAYEAQELNYDIIQNCKYLDAVVWESLRLYPPVARVERESATDYKLAKSNIVIPKGMTVSVPIFAIHRDPLNFEEPDLFIPERFLSDGETGCLRENLAAAWCFLPFGGGPRNCLGIRLAMLEVKLCIAQMLRRFRFQADPGTELEHMSDQVLISPRHAFMRLEKRQVRVRSRIQLVRKSTSIRPSQSRKLRRQISL